MNHEFDESQIASISESLIRSHPAPSDPACAYAWESFLNNGDEGLADLPKGLQQLVTIVRLDDGITGEGFRGHFGNATSNDGLIEDSLVGAIDALRKFGAADAVEIATAALTEWLSRLPGWQSALEHGSVPDFESFEAFAAPLDRRWYEQQDAMYAAIDVYMKLHPNEFLHP